MDIGKLSAKKDGAHYRFHAYEWELWWPWA
ncbi:hypothetical protein J2S25_003843 [Mesobacillus stamsii]|uniref:Uncharacterized protein n=1 Tax=Mesobacillus stamsii TaxID=225347 RepID=A0ABU0G1C8_9BACI|nr:hypothetical protein [Mesobacillus stamsii]